jgi:hypothetical protein
MERRSAFNFWRVATSVTRAPHKKGLSPFLLDLVVVLLTAHVRRNIVFVVSEVRDAKALSDCASASKITSCCC